MKKLAKHIEESLRIGLNDKPENDIFNFSDYDIVNKIVTYLDIYQWLKPNNGYNQKEPYFVEDDIKEISKLVEKFILDNNLENINFDDVHFKTTLVKEYISPELVSKYEFNKRESIPNIWGNELYKKKSFTLFAFYKFKGYVIGVTGPYGGTKWCIIENV